MSWREQKKNSRQAQTLVGMRGEVILDAATLAQSSRGSFILAFMGSLDAAGPMAVGKVVKKRPVKYRSKK